MLLVGRDRELAALDDVIARAAMRERAVVAITGEPGIGKSRLLEELARRSSFAGGRAVWGRCDEVGLTPAFWPFLQILRALETKDAPSPDLISLDQRADASTRLARFEDVVGFVRQRAELGLVVLMFDDMHAADLSSLQLLEYALPRLVDARVAVAIAARDRDATPQVATALGRLSRGAQRLALARLGRDEVTTLVGDRVSRDASARVWELSEGNPLFIEELVASYDGGLPHVSSVRSVIRDRVDRLDAETVDALVAAAVIGREFRSAVVGDMLAVGDEEVARRIAPVVRLGIVVPVSGDRHKFSHVLVAEVLANELDPGARARLHLRAAEALERRDPDRSAIAHHLLAAGHLAADAAVGAAEKAAALAMAQLAFEDAAALLERALHVLPLAAPGDHGRRARLLLAWAEALQHAGEHARAQVPLDETAQIARALGDAELVARTALVRGIEMRFGFPNPALVEALREADAQLAPTSPLRPKVLARLAAAEQPAPDPRGPANRAREAIALARPLADRDRLDVLYTATAALVDYASGDELVPILDETLALARATNERAIAMHTRVRLAFAHLDRGDRRSFDETVEIARGEAASLGLPRWRRATHLLVAAGALLDGRFEDAERAADAAEDEDAEPQAAMLCAAHRLFAASVRGIVPAQHLRHVMLSYTPGRAIFAAWLATLDGDADAARTALAQIDLSTVEEELLVLLVPSVVLAGTREQAAGAYERLRDRDRPILVASMLGSCVLELLERVRMMLATRLGQWDAIDACAERALASAARLDSPVWIARMRADWADALDARARAGDRERAIELRAAARADAGRIGMMALVERLSTTAAPAKPAAGEPVTITKEGDLWIVRGFGELAHIKDSRGIQMIARLVAEPMRELHVLDLVGTGEAVDGGDSGELLDAKARASYKARLSELIAERDQAEAWSDAGRAERATAEIEALTAELERAIGSGGRARRGGSASERARSNVQRRVQHALSQIRAASPRLGEHLAATVHTGTYCSYRA